MKRVVLACLAAIALCSGCIFDDEFWEDDYGTYDYPSDDCDCDEEYFTTSMASSPRPVR